jgi:hypothetical protein
VQPEVGEPELQQPRGGFSRITAAPERRVDDIADAAASGGHLLDDQAGRSDHVISGAQHGRQGVYVRRSGLLASAAACTMNSRVAASSPNAAPARETCTGAHQAHCL